MSIVRKTVYSSSRQFSGQQKVVSKKKLCFVLSTHWDREWHQTFQGFRYSLVELLDNVLGGYESGELRGPFQTDGQAVVIEDYLDIRKGKRDELSLRAQSGDLVIGPWYVMPDEFLVSGEAMVRNLEMGRRVCEGLGVEPSRSGYVCDIFGHCSQLPQIFQLSGVEFGFLWRGLAQKDNTELIWVGSDGTDLPCYVFVERGYGDYAFEIRQVNMHKYWDYSETTGRIREYAEKKANLSQTDAVLLLDGCDHQHWDREAYKAFCKLMEDKTAEFDYVHTSLDGYAAMVLEQKDKITSRVEGELRVPGIHSEEITRWLLVNVLSSHVKIKQRNCHSQNLLCHQAEPLALMGHKMLGCEAPNDYLELAWKYLLKNQAHDSICGCSIDRVHRDMMYRSDQCDDIGEKLVEENLKRLACSSQQEIGPNEQRVAVYNPLARPVKKVVEMRFDVPVDWPSYLEYRKFEKRPIFHVYDDRGNMVDCQQIRYAPAESRVRLRQEKIPEKYEVFPVFAAVELDLPALGYTTLTLRPGRESEYVRGRTAGGLAVSSCAMANEYLAVEIQDNGSVSITDKRSGRRFDNLLVFEDNADLGDGWDHYEPLNSMTYSSTAGRVDVALVYDGPLASSFLVRNYLNLPVEYDRVNNCRSRVRRELVIENTITLRSGAKWVDVETKFVNDIKDHRLRVSFDSGGDVESFYTDTPFDVVERQIKLPKNNHELREVYLNTVPQQSWTAIYDDKQSAGLAIVADGILETAVRDLPARPVSLTLLRAFERLVFDQKGVDSQMPGEQRFNYRIVPLAKRVDFAALADLALDLANGNAVVQVDYADMRKYRVGESLAGRDSFCEVLGQAVVSALRSVGDKWQLRLFNPSDSTIEVKVKLHEKLGAGRLALVDLKGDILENVSCDAEGLVKVSMAAKKIVTVQGG